MFMTRLIIISFLFSISLSHSQENITYQKPSKEILDLVDFERPPNVIFDDNKDYLVFLFSKNYKSIEELSEKELRLAGLKLTLRLILEAE